MVKQTRTHCPNLNHGKTNPPVQYCPTCGEHFRSQQRMSCNREMHQSMRKDRNIFCYCCGKNLAQVLGK